MFNASAEEITTERRARPLPQATPRTCAPMRTKRAIDVSRSRMLDWDGTLAGIEDWPEDPLVRACRWDACVSPGPNLAPLAPLRRV